jgi:hypothetical protein
MFKNIGSADRIIRLLAAITIIILIAAGALEGIAAILLGIFAAIFLITSFIGFCPAYFLFKLNTNKVNKT